MSDVTVLDQPASGDLSETMAMLREQADSFAAHAHGAGTQRAYRSAWGGYVTWCRSVDRDPLGGDSDTVALYIAARARDLSASSINLHLAAIKEAHRLAGVSLDAAAPHLSMVLEGVRRVIGTRPRRKAAAAVPDVLRLLLATRKPSSTATGARDRAMLLIGFGAALRRSELVALRIGDVTWESGHGLVVMIARSKTDQTGDGQEISICENLHDPEFCPAVALDRWMEHRRRGLDGGTDDRALFCSINRGGALSCEALGDQVVSRLIGAAAEAAGLPAGDYSGHSLRRGFATAAARAGVGLPELMKQTRHASARVALGYIEEAGRWENNASASVFRGRK